MTLTPQLVVPCADLDAAIAFLGLRLDMIMPADAPRIALGSCNGIAVRLVRAEHEAAEHFGFVLAVLEDAAHGRKLTDGGLHLPDGMRIDFFDDEAPPVVPEGKQEFLITRASDHAWAQGRAGMLYRDLIPGRLGGRFIASHIRIPQGGAVDDYVHHHNICFQMIYCRRGWVRVVYEDQGPPFVMREGDCVLQPPHIRHRVLESSAGLEVIEIASPAEHETWRDHDLDLPTSSLRPERQFHSQRFVRHIAADAKWHEGKDRGFTFRDTGITCATGNLAGVRVMRLSSNAAAALCSHDGEFLFLAVLDGQLRVRCQAFGAHTLEVDDCCVIPKGTDYALEAATPCEVLEVALPAR